jgi:hypothetical protein
MSGVGNRPYLRPGPARRKLLEDLQELTKNFDKIRRACTSEGSSKPAND